MKNPRPDERRTTPGPLALIELRDEGDHPVAVGYASVFETLSQNLGGFVERVAPGAFTKTIQEQDVRALWNHDPSSLLGRLGAGTLRLSEDKKGLRFEVDLPPTTLGRDVQALLQRGDVNGASFGFRAVEDDWGLTSDDFPLRTLTSVALRDVGPVTFPAYTSTEAALRSLAEARSLDVHDLLEAADHGELRNLIVPSDLDGGRPPATPAVLVRRSNR